jgi:hypothetical protein
MKWARMYRWSRIMERSFSWVVDDAREAAWWRGWVAGRVRLYLLL